MTTNVIMPVLGMAQDSGKIVRWLKNVGDTVSQGEVLLEVETDKAVQELEAPASGRLSQILAHEGDVVPVTQAIAVILAPGEAPAANQPSLPAGMGLEALPAAATLIPPPPAARPAQAARATPGPHAGRILASPKARRLAQEAHLDLALLPGSGPDGAVLASDVESYTPPALQVQLPAPAPLAQPAIAAQASELRCTVRAAQFLAWQTVLQKATPAEITTADLLLWVAARALVQHPPLNATWQDGTVRRLPEINLSLAVSVEEGMAWPVIRQADRLGLSGIVRQRQALAARAQSGQLRPEDSSGGTFTFSYLGMYRVDSFKAALPGAQAAGLAVGRICEQVIPFNGAPSVQPVMDLSLSFDPRLVSDAAAARFLETLAGMVEEPLMLLA